MNLFDVALIFLKEDAILSDNVQLASLPRINQDCPPGNSLTLSGWGKDPYQKEDHHILWAVKQECLDVGECDRFDSLKDKDLVLCVGDKRDPRNSGYRGDSGGKIFVAKLKCRIFKADFIVTLIRCILYYYHRTSNLYGRFR